MYKQYIQDANISLEKGTENVPNDGKYHIIKDNKIIYSHKNEKVAIAKFAEFKPIINKQDKAKTVNKSNLLSGENADRLISQQASLRISKKNKKGGRKGL